MARWSQRAKCVCLLLLRCCCCGAVCACKGLIVGLAFRLCNACGQQYVKLLRKESREKAAAEANAAPHRTELEHAASSAVASLPAMLPVMVVFDAHGHQAHAHAHSHSTSAHVTTPPSTPNTSEMHSHSSPRTHSHPLTYSPIFSRGQGRQPMNTTASAPAPAPAFSPSPSSSASCNDMNNARSAITLPQSH